MLANIFSFIVGVLVLVSAGALSYMYLELDRSVSKPIPAEEATSGTVGVQKEIPTKNAEVPGEPEARDLGLNNPIPANHSLVLDTATTVKNVVEPGPLRETTGSSGEGLLVSTKLSNSAVIKYTNSARALNGALPALAENELLGRDAQIKLNDMFTKQYFEHESPTGVGPSDIAKTVGYEFILVGENLALGDFENDEKLVEAWMNSPGHRANILNPHYQEIGVAVGQGIYEGRLVWIAVQSFGMPLSACPAIDVRKKAQIEANNIEIAKMTAVLETKKAQILAMSTEDPNYNVYVSEFNALVIPYNMAVVDTRTLIVEYNLTVEAFNACVAATGTTTATH
ncbi:MAG: CAP domain-containing protein [Minisyncoccota bacterium]